MKTYGIVLAYPPGLSLRGQGLAVHLVRLIDGILDAPDASILVACPGWMAASLRKHLDECFIDASRVIIVSTAVPYSLRFLAWKGRPRERESRWRTWAGRLADAAWPGPSLARTRARLLEARTIPDLSTAVLAAVLLTPRLSVAVLGTVARRCGAWVLHAAGRMAHGATRGTGVTRAAAALRQLARDPRHAAWIITDYERLHEDELARLGDLMRRQRHVEAWLCPTAFWPALSRLDLPLLVIVPDITPIEHPVGFAAPSMAPAGGVVKIMNQVVDTAKSARRIVTYSEAVRDQTLGARLGIDPCRVRVIPHGTTDLSPLIRERGSGGDDTNPTEFCRALLAGALARAINRRTPIHAGGREWRFILYPSQYRPNKNVIGLVDAYEVLLRRHLVPEKLLLTGSHRALIDHVNARGLQDEVVILPDLTDQELAAAYRLASLAVSPTLAEGACPFMVSEALSVGTPVVCSDIPVTREVVRDPTLRDAMCFDPYDREDMVKRMLWALQNRDALLRMQQPLWREMSARTWAVAAREYRHALDETAVAWRSSGVDGAAAGGRDRR